MTRKYRQLWKLDKMMMAQGTVNPGGFRTHSLNLSILKRLFIALAYILIIGILLPEPGYTYVGPGAGLSVIGTIVALIIALILAIVGFMWYPFKRLLEKLKGRQRQTK